MIGALFRGIGELTIRRGPPRAGRGRRDPLGPAGERAAMRHLRRRGYRRLRRNVSTSMGEVDLICLAPDGRTIVFVEVKARRLSDDAPARRIAPETAVGPRKRRRLLALAKALARRNGWEDRPLRIDVVAIEWPRRGKPSVRHIENVVTG